MATHISILPLDVLDTLALRLNDLDATSTKSAGESLRFLRLPHPRTGIPSLFLPYHKTPSPSSSPSDAQVDGTPLKDARPDTPESSILEVQAIAPSNARSWLMRGGEGEVIADGKLLMMTPIDPAFLLLPIMQAVHPTDGTLGTFRPLQDIFDDAAAALAASSAEEKDPSSRVLAPDVLRLLDFDCVRHAARSVCDVKDITPELSVFRLSVPTTLTHLRTKVARLAAPAVFDRSRTLVRALARDGLMEDGAEQLLESARLRSACDLLAQYLPRTIYTALLSSYDFAALTTHLDALHAAATAAALAASEAKTKKGGAKSKAQKEKDKEAGKGGAKRKAAGSLGVEKLKKANVGGMQKLSSFFAKA